MKQCIEHSIKCQTATDMYFFREHYICMHYVRNPKIIPYKQFSMRCIFKGWPNRVIYFSYAYPQLIALTHNNQDNKNMLKELLKEWFELYEADAPVPYFIQMLFFKYKLIKQKPEFERTIDYKGAMIYGAVIYLDNDYGRYGMTYRFLDEITVYNKKKNVYRTGLPISTHEKTGWNTPKHAVYGCKKGHNSTKTICYEQPYMHRMPAAEHMAEVAWQRGMAPRCVLRIRIL